MEKEKLTELSHLLNKFITTRQSNRRSYKKSLIKFCIFICVICLRNKFNCEFFKEG